MKLIILGNGFDLHHKYKTSFSDFRNHLKNSKDSDDKLLVLNIDTVLIGRGIDLEKNILWNDFERIIGLIMKDGSKTKIAGISLLDLTERFTERFYHYLIKESSNKFTKNSKIQDELKNASSILTFNYTKQYLPYLVNKNIDIFHIHGELVENNLPLIGYFYPNIAPTGNIDFLIRYHDMAFHKPALAYKQNELDLNLRINQYIDKWLSRFSEIVIIGYSFGESDTHIYNILDKVLVKQDQSEHIPFTIAKKVPIIKFKFYNYNNEETKKLIAKVKSNLFSKNKRRSTINITKGFTRTKKEIINFEIIDY